MEERIYAGRLKDRDELNNSSSGGAFTALSNVFLESGNAVCASIYDYTENELKFTLIHTKEERDKARGSKYFQSTMGDILVECKDYLDKHPNNYLAFFGTGCQSDAFLNYMKNFHLEDRLVAIDIICYGVINQQIWSDYLLTKTNNQKDSVSYISFKDKRNGWKNPTAVMTVDDNEKSIQDYVNLFYSKYALRPNCYKCPYTSYKRNTDITIGDFWGIDKTIPNFYDALGNSLFIIHSKKGQELFELIKPSIDYLESNKEQSWQGHLEKPTEKPDNREDFWNKYDDGGINMVIKKYGTKSLVKRVEGKTKSIVKKLMRGGF